MYGIEYIYPDTTHTTSCSIEHTRSHYTSWLGEWGRDTLRVKHQHRAQWTVPGSVWRLKQRNIYNNPVPFFIAVFIWICQPKTNIPTKELIWYWRRSDQWYYIHVNATKNLHWICIFITFWEKRTTFKENYYRVAIQLH